MRESRENAHGDRPTAGRRDDQSVQVEPLEIGVLLGQASCHQTLAAAPATDQGQVSGATCFGGGRVHALKPGPRSMGSSSQSS